MKKIFASLTTFAMFLFMAVPVLAMKPTDNQAAAKHIGWNLSGEVMPAPYGTADIEGSDELSKLIVNQPNGRTETAMSGVMKGLNPDTQYTVYLSKGYTPYTATQIATTWTWNVLNGAYLHDMTIDTYNPVDGTFSGKGIWTGLGTYTDETITGQIIGNQMTFTVTYLGPYSPGSIWTVTGTIQDDGSVTGNVPWTWSTSPGTVIPASGSTGWPGLFTSTIPAFTFTTDVMGEATWHLNLRDENFLGAGSYDMSVWVNGGGKTILVSDVFNVTID